MSTLLQGRLLIPHSTSSAANLRQLRAPRQLPLPRLATCVKAQAASTTQKQQQTSEKRREPTASQDTTHIPIKTDEPTDPAHVTNGSGPKGAGMEVDSVLAKELSENGTLRRRCSYYGDQHFGRVTASSPIHDVMMPQCSHGCRFSKYKTYKNHMYHRAKV